MTGFISSARSLLKFVMTLIMAVILGFLAWGSWRLYENEKQLQQFIKEGHPVQVKVTGADRQPRVWYDQFYSTVYITFNYNNAQYTTRYIQDSGWISTGDHLSLLYHPTANAFRQPAKHIGFKTVKEHSRLLQFSFASMWSDERKWLALSLLLSTVLILVALGMFSSFIQIPLFSHLGRFIITGLVICGALYFTYNSWQYNAYYNKIKNNSQQRIVTVLSTDYHRHSKRSDWWYTYDARVQFNNEQKVIPIEEEDYNNLKAGSSLQVLFNSELNDMMPVNYTADRANLWVALFIWAIAAFFVYTNFIKRAKPGKN